jgi:hypothetical protein
MPDSVRAYARHRLVAAGDEQECPARHLEWAAATAVEHRQFAAA